MSDRTRSICLVNGSLRGSEAASLQFLNDISERLPGGYFNKTVITVKARAQKTCPRETLQSIAGADAIILVFPLHNYGLPGALMRLLEDYNHYLQTGAEYNRDTRVYMIVNCAFTRPADTCGEAIRVIRNFCRRLGINWRFAICIGTGPVVVMTRKIPFLYSKLKKAYSDIAADIEQSGNTVKTDYFIKPVIPESIIAAIKHRYEKKGQMIKNKD